MNTIVISTIFSHFSKATERYLGGPILYGKARKNQPLASVSTLVIPIHCISRSAPFQRRRGSRAISELYDTTSGVTRHACDATLAVGAGLGLGETGPGF